MKPLRSFRWFTLVAGALIHWCGAEFARGADPCEPIRVFADGRQPAREVFVSPAGNNATGNGSRTSPYQTIARAAQQAGPGTAIRLLPGVYSGGTSIAALAGTSNAPIWLGGVPGEAKPEIRGGSAALLLSRVRFLVVEHLLVTGATANGINCDDGSDFANSNATSHVVFRNLEIRDIGTGGNHDGLKLSGVNQFWVLDCEFTRMSANGSGIDQVGCHHGLIARCSFTDMGSNAIQCKGGTADIEIRGNRFVNGGGRAVNIGGSTGLSLFRPPLSPTEPNVEARNIRVFANLFVGSDAPIAFVGAVDCVAANNTIIEPRRWVVRILQETVSGNGFAFRPCGNNRWINNLIVYQRAQVRTPVNIGGNTDPASFEFANNLWFAADQPAQSRPTLPVAERAGIYGANPHFRDPAMADYSVPATSPAAARGQPVTELRSDLQQRCYAETPTVGAFEAMPRPSPSADADGDQLPDDWETAHAFDPHDPADADADADLDTLSNLGEFLAGTDPRDPASRFTVREARASSGNFEFRFASLAGRTYRIELN